MLAVDDGSLSFACNDLTAITTKTADNKRMELNEHRSELFEISVFWHVQIALRHAWVIQRYSSLKSALYSEIPIDNRNR